MWSPWVEEVPAFESSPQCGDNLLPILSPLVSKHFGVDVLADAPVKHGQSGIAGAGDSGPRLLDHAPRLGGDTEFCAEEDVSRQADDRIQVVAFLNEVAADFSLSTATKQDAVQDHVHAGEVECGE